MINIGGNTTAYLQLKIDTAKNVIGERIPQWETVNALFGWLDLASGDAKYTNFDAKIQESTHVFVCDFTVLDSRVTAENSRIVINGLNYDIMLIDNPMELDLQLEIFLKYTGVQ